MILIGMVVPVVVAARWLRMRASADERGETTEKVIITAVFAALALAVASIIVFKVTSKANSIPVDGPPPVAP